jgi:hypothetical protein
MYDIVARVNKPRLICENVARRAAHGHFTRKDARVLEAAAKEIDSLQLGPKVWKDTYRFPYLPPAEKILPLMPIMHHLATEYHKGCSQFCEAWIDVLGEAKLSDSLDLEVSAARWLVDHPDAPTALNDVLGDDAEDVLAFVDKHCVPTYPAAGQEEVSKRAAEKFGRETRIARVAFVLALATGTSDMLNSISDDTRPATTQ